MFHLNNKKYSAKLWKMKQEWKNKNFRTLISCASVYKNTFFLILWFTLCLLDYKPAIFWDKPLRFRNDTTSFVAYKNAPQFTSERTSEIRAIFWDNPLVRYRNDVTSLRCLQNAARFTSERTPEIRAIFS